MLWGEETRLEQLKRLTYASLTLVTPDLPPPNAQGTNQHRNKGYKFYDNTFYFGAKNWKIIILFFLVLL